MHGAFPEDRRLAEWIISCYEVLEAHLGRSEGDYSPAEAVEIILEDAPDEIDLTPQDAEYALDRLLQRGYLYEVDGQLFITETESQSTDAQSDEP